MSQRTLNTLQSIKGMSQNTLPIMTEIDTASMEMDFNTPHSAHCSEAPSTPTSIMAYSKTFKSFHATTPYILDVNEARHLPATTTSHSLSSPTLLASHPLYAEEHEEDDILRTPMSLSIRSIPLNTSQTPVTAMGSARDVPSPLHSHNGGKDNSHNDECDKGNADPSYLYIPANHLNTDLMIAAGQYHTTSESAMTYTSADSNPKSNTKNTANSKEGDLDVGFQGAGGAYTSLGMMSAHKPLKSITDRSRSCAAPARSTIVQNNTDSADLVAGANSERVDAVNAGIDVADADADIADNDQNNYKGAVLLTAVVADVAADVGTGVDIDVDDTVSASMGTVADGRHNYHSAPATPTGRAAGGPSTGTAYGVKLKVCADVGLVGVKPHGDGMLANALARRHSHTDTTACCSLITANAATVSDGVSARPCTSTAGTTCSSVGPVPPTPTPVPASGAGVGCGAAGASCRDDIGTMLCEDGVLEEGCVGQHHRDDNMSQRNGKSLSSDVALHSDARYRSSELYTAIPAAGLESPTDSPCSGALLPNDSPRIAAELHGANTPHADAECDADMPRAGAQKRKQAHSFCESVSLGRRRSRRKCAEEREVEECQGRSGGGSSDSAQAIGDLGECVASREGAAAVTPEDTGAHAHAHGTAIPMTPMTSSDTTSISSATSLHADAIGAATTAASTPATSTEGSFVYTEPPTIMLRAHSASATEVTVSATARPQATDGHTGNGSGSDAAGTSRDGGGSGAGNDQSDTGYHTNSSNENHVPHMDTSGKNSGKDISLEKSRTTFPASSSQLSDSPAPLIIDRVALVTAPEKEWVWLQSNFPNANSGTSKISEFGKNPDSWDFFPAPVETQAMDLSAFALPEGDGLADVFGWGWTRSNDANGVSSGGGGSHNTSISTQFHSSSAASTAMQSQSHATTSLSSTTSTSPATAHPSPHAAHTHTATHASTTTDGLYAAAPAAPGAGPYSIVELLSEQIALTAGKTRRKVSLANGRVSDQPTQRRRGLDRSVHGWGLASGRRVLAYTSVDAGVEGEVVDAVKVAIEAYTRDVTQQIDAPQRSDAISDRDTVYRTNALYYDPSTIYDADAVYQTDAVHDNDAVYRSHGDAVYLRTPSRSRHSPSRAAHIPHHYTYASTATTTSSNLSRVLTHQHLHQPQAVEWHEGVNGQGAELSRVLQEDAYRHMTRVLSADMLRVPAGHSARDGGLHNTQDHNHAASAHSRISRDNGGVGGAARSHVLQEDKTVSMSRLLRVGEPVGRRARNEGGENGERAGGGRVGDTSASRSTATATLADTTTMDPAEALLTNTPAPAADGAAVCTRARVVTAGDYALGTGDVVHVVLVESGSMIARAGLQQEEEEDVKEEQVCARRVVAAGKTGVGKQWAWWVDSIDNTDENCDDDVDNNADDDAEKTHTEDIENKPAPMSTSVLPYMAQLLGTAHARPSHRGKDTTEHTTTVNHTIDNAAAPAAAAARARGGAGHSGSEDSGRDEDGSVDAGDGVWADAGFVLSLREASQLTVLGSAVAPQTAQLDLVSDTAVSPLSPPMARVETAPLPTTGRLEVQRPQALKDDVADVEEEKDANDADFIGSDIHHGMSDNDSEMTDISPSTRHIESGVHNAGIPTSNVTYTPAASATAAGRTSGLNTRKVKASVESSDREYFAPELFFPALRAVPLPPPHKPHSHVLLTAAQKKTEKEEEAAVKRQAEAEEEAGAGAREQEHIDDEDIGYAEDDDCESNHIHHDDNNDNMSDSNFYNFDVDHSGNTFDDNCDKLSSNIGVYVQEHTVAVSADQSLTASVTMQAAHVTATGSISVSNACAHAAATAQAAAAASASSPSAAASSPIASAPAAAYSSLPTAMSDSLTSTASATPSVTVPGRGDALHSAHSLRNTQSLGSTATHSATDTATDPVAAAPTPALTSPLSSFLYRVPYTPTQLRFARTPLSLPPPHPLIAGMVSQRLKRRARIHGAVVALGIKYYLQWQLWRQWQSWRAALREERECVLQGQDGRAEALAQLEKEEGLTPRTASGLCSGGGNNGSGADSSDGLCGTDAGGGGSADTCALTAVVAVADNPALQHAIAGVPTPHGAHSAYNTHTADMHTMQSKQTTRKQKTGRSGAFSTTHASTSSSSQFSSRTALQALYKHLHAHLLLAHPSAPLVAADSEPQLHTRAISAILEPFIYYAYYVVNAEIPDEEPWEMMKDEIEKMELSENNEFSEKGDVSGIHFARACMLQAQENANQRFPDFKNASSQPLQRHMDTTQRRVSATQHQNPPAREQGAVKSALTLHNDNSLRNISSLCDGPSLCSGGSLHSMSSLCKEGAAATAASEFWQVVLAGEDAAEDVRDGVEGTNANTGGVTEGARAWVGCCACGGCVSTACRVAHCNEASCGVELDNAGRVVGRGRDSDHCSTDCNNSTCTVTGMDVISHHLTGYHVHTGSAAFTHAWTPPCGATRRQEGAAAAIPAPDTTWATTTAATVGSGAGMSTAAMAAVARSTNGTGRPTAAANTASHYTATSTLHSSQDSTASPALGSVPDSMAARYTAASTSPESRKNVFFTASSPVPREENPYQEPPNTSRGNLQSLSKILGLSSDPHSSAATAPAAGESKHVTTNTSAVLSDVPAAMPAILSPEQLLCCSGAWLWSTAVGEVMQVARQVCRGCCLTVSPVARYSQGTHTHERHTHTHAHTHAQVYEHTKKACAECSVNLCTDPSGRDTAGAGTGVGSCRCAALVRQFTLMDGLHTLNAHYPATFGSYTASTAPPLTLQRCLAGLLDLWTVCSAVSLSWARAEIRKAEEGFSDFLSVTAPPAGRAAWAELKKGEAVRGKRTGDWGTNREKGENQDVETTETEAEVEEEEPTCGVRSVAGEVIANVERVRKLQLAAALGLRTPSRPPSRTPSRSGMRLGQAERYADMTDADVWEPSKTTMEKGSVMVTDGGQCRGGTAMLDADAAGEEEVEGNGAAATALYLDTDNAVVYEGEDVMHRDDIPRTPPRLPPRTLVSSSSASSSSSSSSYALFTTPTTTPTSSTFAYIHTDSSSVFTATSASASHAACTLTPVHTAAGSGTFALRRARSPGAVPATARKLALQKLVKHASRVILPSTVQKLLTTTTIDNLSRYVGNNTLSSDNLSISLQNPSLRSDFGVSLAVERAYTASLRSPLRGTTQRPSHATQRRRTTQRLDITQRQMSTNTTLQRPIYVSDPAFTSSHLFHTRRTQPGHTQSHSHNTYLREGGHHSAASHDHDAQEPLSTYIRGSNNPNSDTRPHYYDPMRAARALCSALTHIQAARTQASQRHSALALTRAAGRPDSDVMPARPPVAGQRATVYSGSGEKSRQARAARPDLGSGESGSQLVDGRANARRATRQQVVDEHGVHHSMRGGSRGEHMAPNTHDGSSGTTSAATFTTYSSTSTSTTASTSTSTTVTTTTTAAPTASTPPATVLIPALAQEAEDLAHSLHPEQSRRRRAVQDLLSKSDAERRRAWLDAVKSRDVQRLLTLYSVGVSPLADDNVGLSGVDYAAILDGEDMLRVVIHTLLWHLHTATVADCEYKGAYSWRQSLYYAWGYDHVHLAAQAAQVLPWEVMRVPTDTCSTQADACAIRVCRGCTDMHRCCGHPDADALPAEILSASAAETATRAGEDCLCMCNGDVNTDTSTGTNTGSTTGRNTCSTTHTAAAAAATATVPSGVIMNNTSAARVVPHTTVFTSASTDVSCSSRDHTPLSCTQHSAYTHAAAPCGLPVRCSTHPLSSAQPFLRPRAHALLALWSLTHALHADITFAETHELQLLPDPATLPKRDSEEGRALLRLRGVLPRPIMRDNYLLSDKRSVYCTRPDGWRLLFEKWCNEAAAGDDDQEKEEKVGFAGKLTRAALSLLGWGKRKEKKHAGGAEKQEHARTGPRGGAGCGCRGSCATGSGTGSGDVGSDGEANNSTPFAPPVQQHAAHNTHTCPSTCAGACPRLPARLDASAGACVSSPACVASDPSLGAYDCSGVCGHMCRAACHDAWDGMPPHNLHVHTYADTYAQSVFHARVPRSLLLAEQQWHDMALPWVVRTYNTAMAVIPGIPNISGKEADFTGVFPSSCASSALPRRGRGALPALSWTGARARTRDVVQRGMSVYMQWRAWRATEQRWQRELEREGEGVDEHVWRQDITTSHTSPFTFVTHTGPMATPAALCESTRGSASDAVSVPSLLDTPHDHQIHHLRRSVHSPATVLSAASAVVGAPRALPLTSPFHTPTPLPRTNTTTHEAAADPAMDSVTDFRVGGSLLSSAMPPPQPHARASTHRHCRRCCCHCHCHCQRQHQHQQQGQHPQPQQRSCHQHVCSFTPPRSGEQPALHHATQRPQANAQPLYSDQPTLHSGRPTLRNDTPLRSAADRHVSVHPSPASVSLHSDDSLPNGTHVDSDWEFSPENLKIPENASQSSYLGCDWVVRLLGEDMDQMLYGMLRGRQVWWERTQELQTAVDMAIKKAIVDIPDRGIHNQDTARMTDNEHIIISMSDVSARKSNEVLSLVDAAKSALLREGLVEYAVDVMLSSDGSVGSSNGCSMNSDEQSLHSDRLLHSVSTLGSNRSPSPTIYSLPSSVGALSSYLNHTRYRHWTALTLAASGGNYACARILVDSGLVDSGKYGGCGYNALVCAVKAALRAERMGTGTEPWAGDDYLSDDELEGERQAAEARGEAEDATDGPGRGIGEDPVGVIGGVVERNARDASASTIHAATRHAPRNARARPPIRSVYLGHRSIAARGALARWMVPVRSAVGALRQANSSAQRAWRLASHLATFPSSLSVPTRFLSLLTPLGKAYLADGLAKRAAADANVLAVRLGGLAREGRDIEAVRIAANAVMQKQMSTTGVAAAGVGPGFVDAASAASTRHTVTTVAARTSAPSSTAAFTLCLSPTRDPHAAMALAAAAYAFTSHSVVYAQYALPHVRGDVRGSVGAMPIYHAVPRHNKWMLQHHWSTHDINVSTRTHGASHANTDGCDQCITNGPNADACVANSSLCNAHSSQLCTPYSLQHLPELPNPSSALQRPASLLSRLPDTHAHASPLHQHLSQHPTQYSIQHSSHVIASQLLPRILAGSPSLQQLPHLATHLQLIHTPPSLPPLLSLSTDGSLPHLSPLAPAARAGWTLLSGRVRCVETPGHCGERHAHYMTPITSPSRCIAPSFHDNINASHALAAMPSIHSECSASRSTAMLRGVTVPVSCSCPSNEGCEHEDNVYNRNSSIYRHNSHVYSRVDNVYNQLHDPPTPTASNSTSMSVAVSNSTANTNAASIGPSAATTTVGLGYIDPNPNPNSNLNSYPKTNSNAAAAMASAAAAFLSFSPASIVRGVAGAVTSRAHAGAYSVLNTSTHPPHVRSMSLARAYTGIDPTASANKAPAHTHASSSQATSPELDHAAANRGAHASAADAWMDTTPGATGAGVHTTRADCGQGLSGRDSGNGNGSTGVGDGSRGTSGNSHSGARRRWVGALVCGRRECACEAKEGHVWGRHSRPALSHTSTPGGHSYIPAGLDSDTGAGCSHTSSGICRAHTENTTSSASVTATTRMYTDTRVDSGLARGRSNGSGRGSGNRSSTTAYGAAGMLFAVDGDVMVRDDVGAGVGVAGDGDAHVSMSGSDAGENAVYGNHNAVWKTNGEELHTLQIVDAEDARDEEGMHDHDGRKDNPTQHPSLSSEQHPPSWLPMKRSRKRWCGRDEEDAEEDVYGYGYGCGYGYIEEPHDCDDSDGDHDSACGDKGDAIDHDDNDDVDMDGYGDVKYENIDAHYGDAHDNDDDDNYVNKSDSNSDDSDDNNNKPDENLYKRVISTALATTHTNIDRDTHINTHIPYPAPSIHYAATLSPSATSSVLYSASHAPANIWSLANNWSLPSLPSTLHSDQHTQEDTHPTAILGDVTSGVESNATLLQHQQPLQRVTHTTALTHPHMHTPHPTPSTSLHSSSPRSHTAAPPSRPAPTLHHTHHHGSAPHGHPQHAHCGHCCQHHAAAAAGIAPHAVPNLHAATSPLRPLPALPPTVLAAHVAPQALRPLRVLSVVLPRPCTDARTDLLANTQHHQQNVAGVGAGVCLSLLSSPIADTQTHTMLPSRASPPRPTATILHSTAPTLPPAGAILQLIAEFACSHTLDDVDLATGKLKEAPPMPATSVISTTRTTQPTEIGQLNEVVAAGLRGGVASTADTHMRDNEGGTVVAGAGVIWESTQHSGIGAGGGGAGSYGGGSMDNGDGVDGVRTHRPSTPHHRQHIPHTTHTQRAGAHAHPSAHTTRQTSGMSPSAHAAHHPTRDTHTTCAPSSATSPTHAQQTHHTEHIHHTHGTGAGVEYEDSTQRQMNSRQRQFDAIQRQLGATQRPNTRQGPVNGVVGASARGSGNGGEIELSERAVVANVAIQVDNNNHVDNDDSSTCRPTLEASLTTPRRHNVITTSTTDIPHGSRPRTRASAHIGNHTTPSLRGTVAAGAGVGSSVGNDGTAKPPVQQPPISTRRHRRAQVHAHTRTSSSNTSTSTNTGADVGMGMGLSALVAPHRQHPSARPRAPPRRSSLARAPPPAEVPLPHEPSLCEVNDEAFARLRPCNDRCECHCHCRFCSN